VLGFKVHFAIGSLAATTVAIVAIAGLNKSLKSIVE
jgi:hypothetical protein